MTGQGMQPVTRRELRVAERDARRPTARLLALVEARTAQGHGRHAAAGTARPAHRAGFRAASLLTSSMVQGAAVVVVTVALFGAGAGHVRAERVTEHEQLVAAAAREVALEHAQLVRVDRATADRLTAQGTAYNERQRTEAVTLAQAAVETADAVVASSALVVSPADLSPLDEAVAHLAELLESAPLAATVTATTPPPTVVDQLLATPSAVQAMAAATDLLASGTTTAVIAGPSASSTPSPTEPATSSDMWVSPTASTPDVSPTATTAPTPPAGPAAVVTPAPAGELPPPSATDAVDHLALSAQLVAAAETVTELSAQVQAVADATIAAAEAAARSEAEAQAAALEREHKIAVAADAPNGEIPQDALCEVSFDADTELRCDAAEALEDLNDAYRDRFGTNLSVSSSYRDYAGQVAARRARGFLAGAPGTSNHGRGLAADFSDFGAVGQFDTPAYRWMKAHAADYGWYHPDYMEPGGAGPYEPWHWEFGQL
ncbi:D-alanyl-D-alanine carboxypeptidase family protein [Cellulomonas sp. KRMCY2]|uniref:M15 family metallopeptidase n=1 Tax=Cellulomonas sp. KRMCY2 TaxID=1304865 RepID=UPI00045E8576|nr:M15 family metallopeptidase [Cellulomonas sp. KRMCY2]